MHPLLKWVWYSHLLNIIKDIIQLSSSLCNAHQLFFFLFVLFLFFLLKLVSSYMTITIGLIKIRDLIFYFHHNSSFKMLYFTLLKIAPPLLDRLFLPGQLSITKTETIFELHATPSFISYVQNKKQLHFKKRYFWVNTVIFPDSNQFVRLLKKLTSFWNPYIKTFKKHYVFVRCLKLTSCPFWHTRTFVRLLKKN